MRAVGGATSPAGTPNVGSSRHRTATLLGGLVATLALAGGLWLLAGEQSAAADEHLQGEIIDFDILVADEPLTVGDTIVFTNEGERPHTVTDRGDTFDTDGIQPGGTAEVIFDAAGTFEIFCRINPGSMNATVVVEPDDEPPEKVRVQTFDPNFDPHPEQLRFDPPELEVRPGTEVSVANVGGASHTLTANDATFDTGEIAPGAEEGRFPGSNASFVVDELGEYAFRCLIHPEAMQGTLVVAGEPLDAEPEEPPPEEPPPEEEDPDPGADVTAEVAIAMADLSFDPFEIAVPQGAQMTWSNEGSALHTATFDEVEGRIEGLDTGTVGPGDSGTLTAPDAPGSYSYLCTIHPTMRGVVVVTTERAPPDGAPSDDDPSDEAPPDEAPPEDEPVEADAADDDAEDVAALAAAEGDFSTPALVGAIALLVAGAGAIVIALRARPRVDQATDTERGSS